MQRFASRDPSKQHLRISINQHWDIVLAQCLGPEHLSAGPAETTDAPDMTLPAKAEPLSQETTSATAAAAAATATGTSLRQHSAEQRHARHQQVSIEARLDLLQRIKTGCDGADRSGDPQIWGAALHATMVPRAEVLELVVRGASVGKGMSTAIATAGAGAGAGAGAPQLGVHLRFGSAIDEIVGASTVGDDIVRAVPYGIRRLAMDKGWNVEGSRNGGSSTVK